MSNSEPLEVENIIQCLTDENAIIRESDVLNKKLEKKSNRGVGAGGANTNANGKQFEANTSNEERLLSNGYERIDFRNTKSHYLIKCLENVTIIYVCQNGFKYVIKERYNIESIRCPDEAYIFEYPDGQRVVKILEKKVQNVQGSVDTKLMAGPVFLREYEIVLGETFKVYYGFCVNNYFVEKFARTELKSNRKYKYWKQILDEYGIEVLHGDDPNYFEQLDKWIGLP